ncbi:MAG: phosphotransferase [Rhizobiaceae bacterium]
MFHDGQLAAAPKGERVEMYRSEARMAAAIYRVDFERAGLSTFGKHGNFFNRQIARWTKQWHLSKMDDDIPEIDRLIEWLPANLPAGDQTTIVHGDFRIGNISSSQLVEPRSWPYWTGNCRPSATPWPRSRTYLHLRLVRCDAAGIWRPSRPRIFPRMGCRRSTRVHGRLLRGVRLEDRLGVFHIALALFRKCGHLPGHRVAGQLEMPTPGTRPMWDGWHRPSRAGRRN